MERLLARLERGPLGKLAIENFTFYLVGSMAVVFVLALAKPAFLVWLFFEPTLALHQPWRFVTFLFVPDTFHPVWILFNLFFLYFVGSNLEANWGAFKYNAYYLVGAVATIAAAFLTGTAHGNVYLNQSLLFALATIAPNWEITLWGIIRIKLKWIALFVLATFVVQAMKGDRSDWIAMGVSLGNYLLFFAGDIWAYARGQKVLAKQAARRAATRASTRSEQPATKAGRACAICGARQDEGADIRVCSCERCGGKARELCLEHARNH
jgi:hypothetical protein